MQICTDSQAWLAKKAGVLQVGVEISTAVLVARAPQPGGSGYYYIWDADDNPLNDLPTVTGIDQLRQRCEDFGLRILRLPAASVVDSVLRPLLQDAGYDLSRGSGVPLVFFSTIGQFPFSDGRCWLRCKIILKCIHLFIVL